MLTPFSSYSNDAQHLLIQEMQAEQQALSVLRGTTFTECLKLNSLTPALEVLTSKGTTISIRGADIYDSHTWKKFLVISNQEEVLYQLTEVGERLTKQYKSWLLNEHTARYRELSTEADLAWFERVVMLAVTRHIMEYKYEVYVTQGKKTFADPRIALEMGNLLLLNRIAKESARMVHHIVKEPAQARSIIQQFYEENYRQMHNRALISGEQLPSLPAETLPASALQLNEGEEAHE